MKVILVDDEQPARQRLGRLLRVHPQLEIIAEASDGDQALEKIRQHKPDLIFLDISMPVMSGMQLAKILVDELPQVNIIFTTAYDQFALDAFEVKAQDYLLKPIRQERLTDCLHKIRRQNAPTEQASSQSLTIKDKNTLHKIALSEIIFLHSDQKYTEVHTAERVLLSSDSLKTLEQRFGEQFIRAHRSTLINRDYLIGLQNQQQAVCALLKDCPETPEVSRRHQVEIKQFLQQSS